MRITSLARYQRAARSPRFSDLPLPQRLAAEAHYQRLCARWGADLPQWRRAILAGRAKDLVLRPRSPDWARALRNRRKPETVASPSTAFVSLRVASPPATAELPDATSNLLVNVPSSADESSPSPSSNSAYIFRLDVCGLTTSGNDGSDTAQRILRDLQHAFDSSPRFSLAVPGKDLPRRWAWRLEVVPVP